MKAEDIKAAALKYFTMHGYEGASLSQIADEAGIKKQSIYGHFKGKDDLFMQVVYDVANLELDTRKQIIESNENRLIKEQLYHYLLEHKRLVDEDERFRFWLRISFFPPSHLYDEVEQVVNRNEKEAESILRQAFALAMERGLIPEQQLDIPTLAFLGLLDALALELVYDSDPQRIDQKLAAGWKVFWRGISAGDE